MHRNGCILVRTRRLHERSQSGLRHHLLAVFEKRTGQLCDLFRRYIAVGDEVRRHFQRGDVLGWKQRRAAELAGADLALLISGCGGSNSLSFLDGNETKRHAACFSDGVPGIRDLAASHDGYDKQQRADLLIAKGCCDAAGRLLQVNGLQASAILPPQSVEEGAIGLRRADDPDQSPVQVGKLHRAGSGGRENDHRIAVESGNCSRRIADLDVGSCDRKLNFPACKLCDGLNRAAGVNNGKAYRRFVGGQEPGESFGQLRIVKAGRADRQRQHGGPGRPPPRPTGQRRANAHGCHGYCPSPESGHALKPVLPAR